MQITKEELAAQYEKLTNGELLRRVESGTLTPLASEVAREELLSRGVKLEREDEEVSPHDSDEVVESSDPADQGAHEFVTIAQMVNPLRANLLWTHLQSEGIVAHVLGEHLGFANIVLSTGTGGIRVQVRSDQVARAQEVLARFDQIEKEIHESNSEQPVSQGEIEDARKKRESLNRPSSRLFFWIFAILAVGVALYLAATGSE